MNCFLPAALLALVCAASHAAPKARPEYVRNGVAIYTTRGDYNPGDPPEPDLPRKIRLTPQEVINIADRFMRDALGPEFPLHVASVGLADMRLDPTDPHRRAWLWSVRYLEVRKGATDDETHIVGNALRVYLTAAGRVLMRKANAPPSDPAAVAPSATSEAPAHLSPALATATVPDGPHILYVRKGVGIHEDLDGYDPGPFDPALPRKHTSPVPDVVKAADNFLRQTYGKDFPLQLSGLAIHRTHLPGGAPAWLWNVDYLVPEDLGKGGADKRSRLVFFIVLAPDTRVLMGVKRNVPDAGESGPKSGNARQIKGN